MEPQDSVITQAAFKDAMAETCSPVTIVTVLHDGVPHGTTVSAFASLSLDPPMVVVALSRSSELLAKLTEVGTFGVNVLRSDQDTLATTFASKAAADRFAEIPWTLQGGLPRIHGATVWLECDVASVVDGGDHLLVVGAVEHASVRPAAPLTYHRRSFGTHAPHVELPVASAS